MANHEYDPSNDDLGLLDIDWDAPSPVPINDLLAQLEATRQALWTEALLATEGPCTDSDYAPAGAQMVYDALVRAAEALAVAQKVLRSR